MASVSEYVAHIWEAKVDPPNDHSGSGVWNMTAPLLIAGTQRNEHYGFDGIAVEKPDGLAGLESDLVDIEGQQFKAAEVEFEGLEEDESKTFSDVIAGKEGKDMIIVVRGWGVSFDGASANMETRMYWVKLINSDERKFACFAAMITRMDDKGTTVPAKYYDYASGSAKGAETPAGRLAKMKSAAFRPAELGKASPEIVNQATLDN